MAYPIAIQSYCFRHFKPLPDFIAQLKSAGVSATELCGAHANFADPARHAEIHEPFKKAGVQIVAIGVETMTGDVARDTPKFEFCKLAGVKHMSITFAPALMDDHFAGLKRVEQLAEKYDVRLGIHNHGGYDWLGNDTILRYVFSKVGPRIGLHMDTAWAIDAKQNPVKWAEQFADRMSGIHVKDFTYSPQRQPSDVVIGTGNLDLPALMKTLKSGGFAGPVVIEYEGDVQNPVPALKDCVARLQPLM